MNKRRTTTANFAGFFCKGCEGRVFEDDPYWDGNGRKMAVLQCIMCARETFCPWKEYESLLNKIEQVILKRPRNKGRTQQVLSAS